MAASAIDRSGPAAAGRGLSAHPGHRSTNCVEMGFEETHPLWIGSVADHGNPSTIEFGDMLRCRAVSALQLRCEMRVRVEVARAA